ncbi:hypothetical protein Tco_0881740 [Tanacetum coccineum]
MIFLSSAYRSKFPPTNNQLRTLSNPRTQAIIQNGQVMVHNVQGRQSQGYAGSARKNQATGARVVNIVGDAGTNQPMFGRNCEDLQLHVTTNFKADHVDVYDSVCDDEATVNAISMANMSPVGSINDDTVEPLMILTYSLSNVISYADYMVNISNNADNYVPPPVQKNDMILSVLEQMKSQVEKCNTVNQEKQSVNGSLTSKLKRHKERVKTLENESKNSAFDREKYLDYELRNHL